MIETNIIFRLGSLINTKVLGKPYTAAVKARQVTVAAGF